MGAALAYQPCWQSRMRRCCANSGIRANGCGLPSLTSRAGNPVREGVAPIAKSAQTGAGCPRLPVVPAIPHEKALRQQRNPRNVGWGLPSLTSRAGNPVREGVAPTAESAQTGVGCLRLPVVPAIPYEKVLRQQRNPRKQGWGAIAYLLHWQSRMRRCCAYSGICANGLGCLRLPVAPPIPHEKALRLHQCLLRSKQKGRDG
jgi:ribosomal protein L24E